MRSRRGNTEGRLSLRRGPFAPGLTAESGIPEIEILTTTVDDAAELRIEGTRGDDRFRAAGWTAPDGPT